MSAGLISIVYSYSIHLHLQGLHASCLQGKSESGVSLGFCMFPCCYFNVCVPDMDI